METIIGQRIKNSRIHKGLSLQQVAEVIGVSKQMVNKYESGKSAPNSQKLIAFSKLFNQKVDYFLRKPEIILGEINFRKKSKFSIKKVNALKEDVRIKIENYLYVEHICNVNNDFVNPLNNKAINSVEDVKDAVKHIREYWKVGQDAIQNVIELLEDHQIKVIEVDEETGTFDGLATVIDDKYPVIVINKNMPIERKRFTLLHELAHLVLPITGFDSKLQEKFCNFFSSEMLLSEENIRNEFGNKRSSVSFEELKNIQEKYGISISAIIYKLGIAQILSQDRVKNFYMRLNVEPDLKKIIEESRFDSNEHSSRFENLVYRAVSEELLSMSKASSLLQISLDQLKKNLQVAIK